jgi:hypothetical protein
MAIPSNYSVGFDSHDSNPRLLPYGLSVLPLVVCQQPRVCVCQSVRPGVVRRVRVPAPQSEPLSPCVLANHIESLDWQVRQVAFKAKAPAVAVSEFRERFQAFVWGCRAT